MILETSKECTVIYQNSDDEPELYGEPAIVVNSYMDCLTINSVGGHVNVNRSTIPELIKVLKSYQKV